MPADVILGRSAPRLRSAILDGFPFPTFPQLLLSSNDLSELSLLNIPDIPGIGYISPEAMTAGLSALTRLTHLSIAFSVRRSQAGTVQGPPPVTHTLLPALTNFRFCGVSEYLEDLLAQIDVPQLKNFSVKFFGPHISIQPVIRVSQSLTPEPFNRADLRLGPYDATITLYESDSADVWADDDSVPFFHLVLVIMEGKYVPAKQVLSMAQICTQSFPILSSVTELDIRTDRFEGHWTGHDLELLTHNPPWPVLLQPFTAVRTLHLSVGKIRWRFIYWLAWESVTELLPELQNIYLQSPFHDVFENDIERIIAARQHSGHPIAVHRLPRP
ncbi:hypothetical protein BGW80DRAFT_1466313 [Lactifluus volemus]|nr:hypothetical protein BGW80DRAFT_1466313 [Lactifluus volemus]